MVVAYLLFWLFSLIIIVSAFSSAATLSGFAAIGISIIAFLLTPAPRTFLRNPRRTVCCRFRGSALLGLVHWLGTGVSVQVFGYVFTGTQ
jgi:hypothetical protein